MRGEISERGHGVGLGGVLKCIQWWRGFLAIGCNVRVPIAGLASLCSDSIRANVEATLQATSTTHTSHIEYMSTCVYSS